MDITRVRRICLAVLPLLVALAACGKATSPPPGAGAPQPAGPERYSFSAPEVVIYNPAGEVRVEARNGPEVVVEVQRSGEDRALLRVDRREKGGRGSLRVHSGADRIVYSGVGSMNTTTFWIRGNGTFGHGLPGGRQTTVAGAPVDTTTPAYRARKRPLVQHRVWADLVVSLPPGRRLRLFVGAGEVVLDSVSGDIVVDSRSASVIARGVSGPLDIDTGSGDVVVSDAAELVAVNTGSGEVELRRVRGGRVRVTTGSGSVVASELDVAERLEIRTGIGDISLELGGQISVSRQEPTRVSGGLAGGGRLEVRTGRGAIRLR